MLAVASAIAIVAAACGGDEARPMACSPSGWSPVPPGQAYVGQFHAAELFGDQFGLAEGNTLTEFEDESACGPGPGRSGQADVAAGGMTQLIQLIEGGQKVKAFCPVQQDSTEQLAGITSKITSLDQITDPSIRVAVDSPGGLVNFIMNLVFQEKDLGITVNDLQNVTVLGDEQSAACGPGGGRGGRGLRRPVRVARTCRSRSARTQ